jgi:hypothetical protein
MRRQIFLKDLILVEKGKKKIKGWERKWKYCSLAEDAAVEICTKTRY